MSKLRDKPSDMFVMAIRNGYRRMRDAWPGQPVSCSEIWNQIIPVCLQQERGFERMFAWDYRTGRQNRIGTIAEVIRAGYVPGLTVDEHLVVRRIE